MKNKNSIQKTTLFCIHGNSSSSRIFRPWLESTHYNMMAVDLPGHGNNLNQLTTESFSMDAHREYLKKCLNVIEGPIILFGHSLGGHLAIGIAEEIKNLKALIIMGTPPLKKPMNTTEVFLPIPELNYYFRPEVNDEELKLMVEKLVCYSENKEQIFTDFRLTNPVVRQKIAEEAANGNLLDEYTVFKRLPIPKYLLVGEYDPMLNKNYLENCQKEAIDPCELVQIKDCGHFPLDAKEQVKVFVEQVAKTTF